MLFTLRGGIEHRSLKLSRVKRMKNPDHYEYYENVSKNRNGSFKQIHIKSKVVPVFACMSVKFPPPAVAKHLFYVWPLQEIPTDLSAPWYATVPVGRDTLHKNV